MTSAPRFIGFDLGAESGRCIVGTLREGKVTLDEVHRFTTHKSSDGTSLRWRISAIEQEIMEGLAKARARFGSHFEGIGIDTWGVDYVLTGPGGRALGDPYQYRDDRTDGMMAEAFKLVPKEEMYRATGIQFLQFNTSFQLLAERRKAASLLGLADKMLLMPDYLNFVLSGAQKAEYSIASTTGLADPYKRMWHWNVIETLGFPTGVFAEMIEPGTILGRLRAEVAAQTGLDPSTPVIASAGHDTASAVVSVPGEGSEWAYLSSGTWSLMGVELDAPVVSSDGLKDNFTNEGGFSGKTRFLKNIIGLWPIQECRRQWEEEGRRYSYDELAALAAHQGPARSWLDLNDPRFLKPGNMPEKVCAYLRESGQQAKGAPAFVIRSVLESLAFSYRKTARQIKRVTGGKISTLHAVGGGIQNTLLAQLTADAVGVPLLAGPVEGTIVGNIGVQAIATGFVPDLNAWRRCVRDSFPIRRYEPGQSAYFDECESAYDRYVRCS
ncbi:MAG TPA: rhamnulokinase family protein [Bacteroidota bacterium]|nr:rhamnulokinase family protein [Bacteroidota bacterium]